MLMADARGEPMTASDRGSVARFEAALRDVVSFSGDPIGTIEAALAQDPMLVMGHLLRAHTFLFALQPGFAAKAASSLEAAETLREVATPRERLHLAAARAWAEGDLIGARRRFAWLLVHHPRDLTAMMFAHQADFFGGAVAELARRPAAVLAHWEAGLPGRSYVQSMLAFGLEEAGRYREAEELGRAAVAHEPRDVWGIHAVGHVLEMEGRDEEGIAWYEAREPDWAPGSFFAVHNAWHLALYHVDRDDAAAALVVYDRLIRPSRRSILLNLCDAAALLWRLELGGCDVGDRWDEVAALMEPHASVRVHVFDDVHLAVAFAAAGRTAALRELLASLTGLAVGGAGMPALMARVIGLPVAAALAAFSRGDYRTTVAQLLACRSRADLMTGSAAQRDILEVTLIEAALRDGQRGLARGLLERRLERKPHSARIRRDLARCVG